ncbi:hypothetical protein KKE60_06220 [Patescibacteria group bacterium]|nr:hypothetical protein [Patescibacteria group bacterium]
MNLKFQQVDWEKDLMYVEFEADGQRFKWYPKWDDLRRILEAAVMREGVQNNWYSNELEKFLALFLELRDTVQFERGISCAEELQGVEFFPRATRQIAASGGSH